MMMTPDNPVMRAGLFLPLALLAAGATQALARPQAETRAPGSSQALPTQTDSSVGVSLIGYKYDEPKRPDYPDGVMALKATMLSVDYSGTYAFASQWPNAGQGWFVRGEIQYVVGDADYSSPISGTLKSTENWYYELRGHLGRDFQMKGYVLAPYVGFGYRYLFHDFRGDTSLGDPGYRRENRLQTASIGLTQRMRVSQHTRLSTTLEYIHLLKGVQTSRLSDSNRPSRVAQRSDVEKDQNSGYGLRFSSMWRSNKWSFGPSLTHWNIKDSEVVGAERFLEPKNTTTEIGFKTSYHF